MQCNACQYSVAHRLSPSPPVNLLLIGQLIGSPTSIESGNLSAPCIAIVLIVVCRRRRPSECHSNYKVCIGGRLCPQNWLPRQRPLRGGKYNTSDHSSAAKVIPILQIS